MPDPFVWFDLASTDADAAVRFYGELLDWKIGAAACDAPVHMVGEGEPWAAIAPAESSGWVPYVEVDDVDAATARACELGGSVVREKTRGPSGWFSVVRDPGGASVALWSAA